MRILVFSAALLVATAASAWTGSDTETSGGIEIERGNLVREGETIDFYDEDSGEYRTGDVESVTRYGGTVEVEVYDSETGDYRTFEMD